MRQLSWAANAAQRAEWDRFARLLNLVDSRTLFGKDGKPLPYEKWYPPGMITKSELRAADRAARAAKERSVIKIPFSVVQQIVLGK